MNKIKKISISLISLVLTLVIFISCSTSVSVSYLKPAKYDLTQYKHLAVASMKVVDVPPFSESFVSVRYDDFEDRLFSGYDNRIAYDVAEEFSQSLYLDLYKTAFFELVKPEITDIYIDNLKYGVNSLNRLRDLGVQALLISQIDYFDYQEYPIIGDYIMIENPEYTSDPTKPQYIESDQREVTIMQQSNVKYSYKVVDIFNGNIIASGSFNKNVNNEVEYEEDLISLPSMKDLYEKALHVGEKQIVEDLSPQYITTNIKLKKDKNADSYYNLGIEAAKKGSLKVAYDNFNKSWNENNIYSSGYNSALVLEALGNRDKAIERMRKVYNYYNKVEAYEQLQRMQQYEYETNVAQSQINN